MRNLSKEFEESVKAIGEDATNNLSKKTLYDAFIEFKEHQEKYNHNCFEANLNEIKELSDKVQNDPNFSFAIYGYLFVMVVKHNKYYLIGQYNSSNGFLTIKNNIKNNIEEIIDTIKTLDQSKFIRIFNYYYGKFKHFSKLLTENKIYGNVEKTCNGIFATYYKDAVKLCYKSNNLATLKYRQENILQGIITQIGVKEWELTVTYEKQ